MVNGGGFKAFWGLGQALVWSVFAFTNLEKTRFKPGEVWTFHEPPGDPENETITVLRIEPDPTAGAILYILITGTDLSSWHQTNMFGCISENAMNKSVVSLIRTNEPIGNDNLEIFNGYYTWKPGAVAAGNVEN